MHLRTKHARKDTPSMDVPSTHARTVASPNALPHLHTSFINLATTSNFALLIQVVRVVAPRGNNLVDVERADGSRTLWVDQTHWCSHTLQACITGLNCALCAL